MEFFHLPMARLGAMASRMTRKLEIHSRWTLEHSILVESCWNLFNLKPGLRMIYPFYSCHGSMIYNTCKKNIQVDYYEIVKLFFHIRHNLTWYSAIVHKFTRIYLVCSTYDKTIHVKLRKKYTINLKRITCARENWALFYTKAINHEKIVGN